MVSEQEIFELWEKEELSLKVQEHCKTVQKAAVALAEKLIEKGREVDLELVKIGALVHDIGRAKTHGITHGVLGYEILQKYNLPEKICRFAKLHVLAGISGAEECKTFGLPEDDYESKTLEEKIVCYTDKLVQGNRIRDFEEVLEYWKKTWPKALTQIRKLEKLHRELEENNSVLKEKGDFNKHGKG